MDYVIFKTGGKQYKASKGDVLDVDVLDLKVGSETTFADVIFASASKAVATGGASAISGVKVKAEIVEHRKAPKVIAFKFRRRKGYHRTVGHRRQLTRLKISSIG